MKEAKPLTPKQLMVIYQTIGTLQHVLKQHKGVEHVGVFDLGGMQTIVTHGPGASVVRARGTHPEKVGFDAAELEKPKLTVDILCRLAKVLLDLSPLSPEAKQDLCLDAIRNGIKAKEEAKEEHEDIEDDESPKKESLDIPHILLEALKVVQSECAGEEGRPTRTKRQRVGEKESTVWVGKPRKLPKKKAKLPAA